jgi:hypothetical protein
VCVDVAISEEVIQRREKRRHLYIQLYVAVCILRDSGVRRVSNRCARCVGCCQVTGVAVDVAISEEVIQRRENGDTVGLLYVKQRGGVRRLGKGGGGVK